MMASHPAAAERYVYLDRMPVVFHSEEGRSRVMVVEITLAVADDQEANLRRRSREVQKAIHEALALNGSAFYGGENAAAAVKQVARRAAQKEVGGLAITDALIKSLQLR